MASDRVARSNGLLRADAAAGPIEIASRVGLGGERRNVLSARSSGDLERADDLDRSRNSDPDPASGWSLSFAKRGFDVLCVVPALLFLSPVVLLISVMVWMTSDGPIVFRQLRMGKGGQPFTIYKFRTMVQGASSLGPGVTKAGDPRLTRLGRFLRKHKLDEIPQLYNVFRGDMSLVGPRPKLPEFEQFTMSCRPGITGAATLAFANEEKMLKDIPPDELDRFHIEVLSPMKRELDGNYQRAATFTSDLNLLVCTVLKRYPSVLLDRKPGPFRFEPEALASYCGPEFQAMRGRPSA